MGTIAKFFVGFFVGVWVLGWLAGTGFFDYQIAAGLIKQHDSRNYSSVTGTVISSVVVETSDSDSSSYAANVTYKYTVGSHEYTSDRLTFGMRTSAQSAAESVVAAHPPGSPVTVYYNPAKPSDCVISQGIDGNTLFGLIFILPFNMIALGSVAYVFAGISNLLRGNPAGGVPIRTEGSTTRATLRKITPIGAAALATLAVSFVMAFVLGFSALGHAAPLWPEVLGLFFIGACAITAYLHRDAKLRSGTLDLVIDAHTKTIQLPQTCGRTAPLQIKLEDLAAIEIEKLVKPSSDGDTTSYFPTLAWSDVNSSVKTARLTEWGSQERAEAFTEWLRKAVASAMKSRSMSTTEV
jgi:hypothetical protein